MLIRKSKTPKTERDKYLYKESIKNKVKDILKLKKYKLLFFIALFAIGVFFSAGIYSMMHPGFLGTAFNLADKNIASQKDENISATIAHTSSSRESSSYLGKLFENKTNEKVEISSVSFEKEKGDVSKILGELGYSLISSDFNDDKQKGKAVFENKTIEQEITYSIVEGTKTISSEKRFSSTDANNSAKTYIEGICEIFDCKFAEKNIYDLYSFIASSNITKENSPIQASGINTIYSRPGTTIEYVVKKEIINGEEQVSMSIYQR